MAFPGDFVLRLIISASLFTQLVTIVNGADIFLEWNVAIDTSLSPFHEEQPVSLLKINVIFLLDHHYKLVLIVIIQFFVNFVYS